MNGSRTWSLTARITLATIGVALVAAALSGVAVARWMTTEQRRTIETFAAQHPGTGRELLAEWRDRDEVPGRQVQRALWTSVLVGAVVGVLAGAATGRLLTGPLRRTAAAAHALGAGDREVRVPEDGPPEVAEVAAALNTLTVALRTSEERQRRFLLSVSHELRTPLTSVRGYAESIADGVVAGEDARAAGAVVLDEAGRLERLVGDLLELARLEADDFTLAPADVDLHDLVARTVAVWAERSPRLAVRGEDDGTAPALRTDPVRLRQVLDGLLANATRVTPAGGVVVLALSGGPRAVVLQVRDSGPGLSAEDRAVAFEPGALGARYRDQRPVGVGIGLSLVHGLVARLGGSIGVDVATEGGASFTVRLPT